MSILYTCNHTYNILQAKRGTTIRRHPPLACIDMRWNVLVRSVFHGISPSFESFLHNHHDLNETLPPLQELYELSDISLFAGVPHHPDGESDTFWPYSPVCARSCQPRLKGIGFWQSETLNQTVNCWNGLAVTMHVLFSTFSQPLSQAQWEVSVPAWFVHASEWLQQWNRLRRQRASRTYCDILWLSCLDLFGAYFWILIGYMCCIMMRLSFLLFPWSSTVLCPPVVESGHFLGSCSSGGWLACIRPPRFTDWSYCQHSTMRENKKLLSENEASCNF